MKNKIWVRLLLALMLAAMVLTAVSCDKNNDLPNDTEEEDTDDGTVTYPFDIEDLGDADGNPGTFNMIVRTERCDYIDAELDGSIIHDAVFERNALIEELYNVEITMFEGGHSEATEYNNNITAEVMAGGGNYDCVLAWDGAGLETRGWFMNLLSFPEFDFENDEWWFDDWTKNATFNDCLITCNGDLQFEIYYDIEVIFYNKTLAGNIDMQPYQYVDNMTWTIEQMEIFSEQVKQEDSINGGFVSPSEGLNAPFESDCIYGSLSNQSVGAPAMFALGAKYATIHDDGTIEWTVNKEYNYNIFAKLYKVFCETEWNYIAPTTTLGEQSYKLFTEDRALFCWNAVRVGELIKPTGVQYGLLPIPMYDEEQGEYITTCYGTSYFAFLACTKDLHGSALILNAMNALSTTVLYDEYFGKVLELRVSDDPDSSRMVPLIRESLYFDFTWINNSLCGGVAYDYGNALNSNNPNIASAMSGATSTLEVLVSKLDEVFLEIREANSR